MMNYPYSLALLLAIPLLFLDGGFFTSLDNTSPSTTQQTSFSECRMRDSLILVDLYNATHENGNWINEWNLNQSMDTWYGVSLNADGCVQCLDLDGGQQQCFGELGGGNNLQGQIPNSIGGLSELELLYLNDNELYGELPEALGDLTKVELIHIVRTCVSGSIPTTLSNLSNLENLYLWGNKLTGGIPPELGQINRLKYLSLGGNDLGGEIPSELGELSNLVELYLWQCNLTGNIPIELGDLSVIEYLNLEQNSLTGSIPPQLFNASNIRSLWLWSNNLSGSIPEEIGNLRSVEKIYLYDNNLSGCFPASLKGLCHLGYSNNFSEKGYNFFLNADLPGGGDFGSFCEEEFGCCETPCGCDAQEQYEIAQNICRNFGIPENEIEYYIYYSNFDVLSTDGIQINSKGCISSIYWCDYHNFHSGDTLDNVTYDFPMEISSLTELTYLNLADKRIKSEIPAELFLLDNLKTINLGKNQFWGELPNNIGWASSLVSLNLNDNELSGNLPLGLSSLIGLRDLSISNNQLSGSINADVFNMPNIINISLSGNNFMSIPTNIQLSDSLKYIYLGSNNIEMELPIFTNNSTKLYTLNLSNNKFYGEIPAIYNEIEGLNGLYLHSNNLSGELPFEEVFFEKNPYVSYLTFSKNQFIGSINPYIGSLNELEVLLLHDNKFEGEIPISLTLLNKLQVLSLSNNFFTGTVPEFDIAHLFIHNNRFNSITSLDLSPVPINECSPTPIFFECISIDIIPLYKVLDQSSISLPETCDSVVFFGHGNRFTFEDLDQVLTIPSLKSQYTNQDSIFQDTTIYVNIGEDLTIDLAIDQSLEGGFTPNTYRWYKDGANFRNPINTNKLTFTDIQLEDAGTYNCTVQNSDIAPALTLYSHNIRLVVDCEPSYQPYNTQVCSGDTIMVEAVAFYEGYAMDTIPQLQTSLAGCDELLVVSVDFIASDSSLITENYCNQTDFLMVNNQRYDIARPSGTEVMSNSMGCDSIVQINLTYKSADTTSLEQILCPSESITVNGTIYNVDNPSGIEEIIGSECDSFVMVNLSFASLDTGYLQRTLCPTGFIEMNGNRYDQANPTGTEIVAGAVCDSVVIIELAFSELDTTLLQSTLCPSESLTINGTVYSMDNPSGLETLQGNNCDSIVNINLSFYDSDTTLVNAQLCPTESIMVNGTRYDQFNPYGLEILAGSTCDSIVQIDLAFTAADTGQVNQTLCRGDFLTIDGVRYDEANVSGITSSGQNIRGCDSLTRVQLTFVDISAEVQVSAPSCAAATDGVLQLQNFQNGTPPYTVSIAQNEQTSGYQFRQLAAGTYEIVVTDVEGCQTKLLEEVPMGEELIVSLEEIPAVLLGAEVQIIPNWNISSPEDYIIEWYRADSLLCVGCLDISDIPLESTTYELRVQKNDVCRATAAVGVFVDQRPQLYLPTAFSPNEDGANDYFFPQATNDLYQIKSLVIFDRWGNQVFAQEKFVPNQPMAGWNGIHQGQLANEGIYVYKLVVGSIDGTLTTQTGDFFLMR